MTELEPLSPEMIRRYLGEIDAAYEVDEDGDFVFQYGPEPGLDSFLTVTLEIIEREGYSIVIGTERSYPSAEWDRLMRVCNAWNAEQMYPTAYVLTDPEKPDEVDIFLDYSTIFKSGVSREQFRQLTDEIVASAFVFWVLAHRDHGL
jgi:hypothetical protein